MSWHLCKVITLFAGGVKRSHWALQPPPPSLPQRPGLTAVWCVVKNNIIKRNCLDCSSRRLTLFAVSLLPFFQQRVEVCLKRLWFYLYRKWNVELIIVQWQRNPWSLFLSTCTPTHAHTAGTNSIWGFCLFFEKDSSGSTTSTQLNSLSSNLTVILSPGSCKAATASPTLLPPPLSGFDNINMQLSFQK